MVDVQGILLVFIATMFHRGGGGSSCMQYCVLKMTAIVLFLLSRLHSKKPHYLGGYIHRLIRRSLFAHPCHSQFNSKASINFSN